MIKKRGIPHTLRFLNALIPRIHSNHPQHTLLKTQAAKSQKGLNGERKLDYHLLVLPSEKYGVLSDISFKQKATTFQMDSLIITNHAIYIVDSKSIDGEAIFNTQLEQLTQKHQQREKSFTYQFTQLEYIKFQLMNWLQQRSLTGFPIYYFISIAESTTILKVIGDEAYVGEHVTFAENIPFFIMRKNDELEKRQHNGQPTLRNQIITKMMSEYHDLHIDYMKKFNITARDILPGVVCAGCYKLKTVYLSGKWICQNCGTIDRYAYKRTLEDFFLLFGSSISNKEARWFLCVPSRVTTTKILQRSGLQYNRKNKRWYKRK